MLQSSESLTLKLPNGALDGIAKTEVAARLVPETLSTLKPKHLEIISLHLAGFKNRDIAKRVSCTTATVINVLQSDAGRDVIVSAMERYYTDFMELAPDAIMALKDSLRDDSNPDLRLRAAGMWLKGAGWENKDRGGGAEAQVRQILIQADNVQLNG